MLFPVLLQSGLLLQCLPVLNLVFHPSSPLLFTPIDMHPRLLQQHSRHSLDLLHRATSTRSSLTSPILILPPDPLAQIRSFGLLASVRAAVLGPGQAHDLDGSLVLVTRLGAALILREGGLKDFVAFVPCWLGGNHVRGVVRDSGRDSAIHAGEPSIGLSALFGGEAGKDDGVGGEGSAAFGHVGRCGFRRGSVLVMCLCVIVKVNIAACEDEYRPGS